MPKALTKSQVAATLAEKAGITKKQAILFLKAQADLAYSQTKNTFVLPGLGKLVLGDRGPRRMVIPFGPDKGQERLIPKKRVVKFRPAKAYMDGILGVKK